MTEITIKELKNQFINLRHHSISEEFWRIEEAIDQACAIKDRDHADEVKGVNETLHACMNAVDKLSDENAQLKSRISELEQEIAALTHAKNEALKWYEDACKEIAALKEGRLTNEKYCNIYNEGYDDGARIGKPKTVDVEDIAKVLYDWLGEEDNGEDENWIGLAVEIAKEMK